MGCFRQLISDKIFRRVVAVANNDRLNSRKNETDEKVDLIVEFRNITARLGSNSTLYSELTKAARKFIVLEA